MSAAGRAAVSRGILLRLREQLEFTKKGQELLKMKRDHLASETNKLLTKVAERNELDRRLMQAYENIKAAYLSLGYSGLQSQASTVDKIDYSISNDELNKDKNKILLKFELKKGCYATSLLREFMKAESIRNY